MKLLDIKTLVKTMAVLQYYKLLVLIINGLKMAKNSVFSGVNLIYEDYKNKFKN